MLINQAHVLLLLLGTNHQCPLFSFTEYLLPCNMPVVALDDWHPCQECAGCVSSAAAAYFSPAVAHPLLLEVVVSDLKLLVVVEELQVDCLELHSAGNTHWLCPPQERLQIKAASDCARPTVACLRCQSCLLASCSPYAAA